MPEPRTASWMRVILRLLVAVWLLVPGLAYAGSPPSPDGVAPSSADAPSVAPAGAEAEPETGGTAPERTDVGAAGVRGGARFDRRTHFSLSWVRLPGTEECISAKQLSRAVELRLRRPAFGAPAASDVDIEGFIEKTDQGTFHAVVTIADARGRILGKRELERPVCRDMDAALALAIALMIDPDAAFAATARPAPDRTAPRVKAAPPSPTNAAPQRRGRVTVTAGIVAGFGNLPRTSEGAWMIAAVEPPATPIPLSVELGARLFLGQTTTMGQDLRVEFSRATFDLAVCPLDAHVGPLRLGACAGVGAGTLTATGVRQTGLDHERRVVVDGILRGRLAVVSMQHLVFAVIPSLGVPFIRDSFNYLTGEGATALGYRLPPVYGEVGVGLGLELP